jgi:hypothetical protein
MIKFLRKLTIMMLTSGVLLTQQSVAKDSKTEQKVTNQSKSEAHSLKTIRGASSTGFKAQLFSRGKGKLRWYDKNNFFTLLKCKPNEAFLVITLKLKRGYTLSKSDYVFKTKKKTYPCLSVSAGRGFGVNLQEVESKKKLTPVRMIYKIAKGDCNGELVFNLNSTIAFPSIEITKAMVK